ncbi:hypothetical protein T10_2144 [Trichinella papuae]|uniref:Uncharacterized protein n=1 Tax=Trichinella papuae TaxID=268474 RepID=A0A0V1MWA6_9BILA|nr:hypothetical protein T10_2144 [Trichinella papuae]
MLICNNFVHKQLNWKLLIQNDSLNQLYTIGQHTPQIADKNLLPSSSSSYFNYSHRQPLPSITTNAQ